MRFRSLAALLALTALPLAAQEHQHGDANHAKQEHPVTVVVIVRHAEKAAAPANDPPLTEVGQQRARALRDAMADANVGAVLHTNTTRTRDTATPVAQAAGLTPEVLPTGLAAQSAAIVEAVRRHAGKTIVIVGHSNTVMPYIAALGGPKKPDLCDHQYDGLYTLVIAHGETRLVSGRYGPPNPAATVACGDMLMAPAARP